MNIRIMVPVRCDKTIGPNGRLHWAAKRRKTQSIRRAVRLLWPRMKLDLPLVVTLTRIAPRHTDSDNSIAALKAVRDEVAACLTVDDGDERVTWRYAPGARPLGRARGGGDVSLRRLEMEELEAAADAAIAAHSAAWSTLIQAVDEAQARPD